ncbi:MAG: ABC transporter substrate-binding protein [Candidatus Hodarchaeota archaeon]
MIFIKKPNLIIGHLSTAYHTNFILMNSHELEKDLNAKIKWILFGTGPEMVQAFKNGQLDIGYMGLTPAIIGIDKKVPIKCIAGGHIEGTIMIAKSNYKTLADLNNNLHDTFSQFVEKIIGVPSKGSIHDVILSHYLHELKLLNDIEVRNYSQAEFIATDMEKGLIQGGVGTPSLAIFASTILDSQLIIPAETLWPNNPSYGIFSRENYIKNNSDLIEKFLVFHKDASNLLRKSPDQAAEIISKTFKLLNRKYVKSVLKISPKYCIALSEEYIKATMDFVDTLYQLGYIATKLDFKDIFILDFVNKIHPEPHHYK